MEFGVVREGYGSRFVFSPLAKTVVRIPFSRNPADVHRTSALRLARLPDLSNKKSTPKGCFFIGAGYGSRTRLHGLGSRCITDIRILRIVKVL